ncbi:MAG TPA: hypothetical protein VKB49_25115 [Candidatus Sulfotelmatobacter sp.]|nr:hypothetical protein [Candidatus Sulfotelmatobacter sp.]
MFLPENVIVSNSSPNTESLALHLFDVTHLGIWNENWMAVTM